MCVCCSRHQNSGPFGWEPSTHSVDSLTTALEWMWLDDSCDTQIEHTVAQLTDAAADLSGNIRGRVLYWQARLAARRGSSGESDSLYAEAFALADSAEAPYLWHRLKWATDPYDWPFTVESYRYLKAEAEFFENAGDKMLASVRWMELAMLLNDLEQYDRAAVVLSHADSLAVAGELTRIHRGALLNKANVLNTGGRKTEGEAILRQLLADSAFLADAPNANAAYHNLFIYNADTTALFSAYEGVRYDSLSYDRAGYYEGALAAVFLARDQLDSAAVYKDMAIAKLPAIDDRRFRIDVLAWVSLVEQALGHDKAASQLLNERLEETELQLQESHRAEVISHDFAEQLAQAQLAQREAALRLRLVAACIAFGVVLLLISIIFIYYRRMQRHRLDALQARLHTEESQRQLLAAKIALEHKDSLISTIESELTDADGDFRHRMHSAIRTHEAASRTREAGFERTFTELHPTFLTRLKDLYPALSETDRRMLQLTALGMNIRQIAETLGIRPESVKQARWRMRAKMGLDADTSIEDALAAIDEK